METGECSATLTGHSDREVGTEECDSGMLLQDSAELGCGTLMELSLVLHRTPPRMVPTSGGDASVLKCEVTKEEELCSVRLLWCATDACIEGTRGLSAINKGLFMQRGAVTRNLAP